MLFRLKPQDINLKRFYIWLAVFMAISGVSIAMGYFYILFLPLVLLTFYFVIFDAEKVMYFLAFAVPLSIPVKNIGGGLELSVPTEPLIILLFIGFIFKLFTGSGFSKAIIKNTLTIIVLADLLWLLITVLTSTMPIISLKYFLARTWFVVVFYLALSHLFKKFKAIHIFIWAFSIATTILVIYTLINHAEGSFTRYYAYTAMRPFLPDHGMYAAAISFCIPPLFIYVIYGHVFKLSIATRAFALALFTIILTGVILSFTRASWLSVAGAFGLYIVMLLGIKFRTIIITALIGLGGFLLLQQDVLNELSRNKNESADNIEEHLNSFSNVSTDPSNLERLNRWNCAFRMFSEKPIFGWGPGTYTFQYAPFQMSSQLTIISTNAGDLGNVHSEYLRPLCESGFLGALGWILIVLFSVNKGFYLYHNGNNLKVRYMALGTMLGLVTYFAHAVLNNYIEFDKIAAPTLGFMAILVALQVWHNQPDQLEAND
jgi:putative inorganic carbon (HCO3(-)) transporter